MSLEIDKTDDTIVTPKKANKGNSILSAQEVEFIRKHAVLPGWTDERIAKELGRSAAGIKKYRKKFGIIKQGTSGEVYLDAKRVHKDSINKSNVSEEKKIELWKKYFKASTHFRRLKKELTSEDLEFFADRWAEYHLQFDDLKPTEEAAIINLVTLDLRISDNRREYRELQEQEKSLRRQIGGRELGDLENEEDRLLFEMVNGNNMAKRECNKQSLEMTKNHDMILKGLNATREQREQHERIGTDTFPKLVKIFTDEEYRIKENEFNELMKVATRSKAKEYRKPYEFADGQIEPILLDGADFINKEKKKDE